ncbi:MAG: hypothetical protein Kow0081_2870 [Candidatus Dojkabacteria bacterium]
MKTYEKLKSNPDLFETYFLKEYTIKAIRKFFEQRNYHELEAPILADALPQERYLDVLHTNIELKDGTKKRAYLIPSTETWNKKILVAGLGNHFVITKVFRGLEEIGPNHAPEFTMLEWYELGHNYLDLMISAERLIQFIISFIRDKKLKRYPFEKNELTFSNNTISLESPWYRFSVRELLLKYLDVELEMIYNLDDLKKFAKSKGVFIKEQDDWQALFEILMATFIEPNLPWDKPIFIYDYPRILCPLTKPKDSDPLVSEKVELYIAGKEVANGYTELLDPEEQEKRFLEEMQARKDLGKEPIEYDQELVNALKLGMPPVAGIGMGLDRLVMILANAKSISDINFFPPSEWS